MSRNDQSYFSMQPDVSIKRSRFRIPFSHKTTIDAGVLVPFYVREVLPGDSVTIDTTVLTRMTTPIFPVMDNCFMDTYYFFVPNRLAWNHWKEFNGENNNSPWTENVEYNVPQTIAPTAGWDKGSVADYMGIPTKVGGFSVNSIPFRDYVLIWNEYFRDANYMRPAAYSLNDASQQGYSTQYTPSPNVMQFEDPRFWSLYSAIGGGKCLPVSKFHDYFTSVLPDAQRGEPVTIPVAPDGVIPVGAKSDRHSSSTVALHGDVTPGGPNLLQVTSVGNVSVGMLDSSLANGASPVFIPDNLWADFTTDQVNIGTISDLRRAFAIQSLLETDGRYGTRYTSILYGHFGVQSPDARLQRPEYLGGKRFPINIDQVIQTSSTDEVSPQGNTAAFSLTVNSDNSFTKSFVEHGFIIGVCCIRTDHTYQQGLEKFWSRKRRFDYYWPELANISAQPVLRKELFITGTDADDNVLGYQEPWADYRYMPNRVSGAFRSNVNGSLDAWHYADYFVDANAGNPDELAPVTIGADFIAETPINIDRTLAVSSDVENQFLCDFYCNSTWTRPMPVFSIPGLTGHM